MVSWYRLRKRSGVQNCGSFNVLRMPLGATLRSSDTRAKKCVSLETSTRRAWLLCSCAALAMFGSKSKESSAVERWLTCSLVADSGRENLQSSKETHPCSQPSFVGMNSGNAAPAFATRISTGSSFSLAAKALTDAKSAWSTSCSSAAYPVSLAIPNQTGRS